MKYEFWCVVIALLISFLKSVHSINAADVGFVVDNADSTKEGDKENQENVTPVNPQIYSMQIYANVSNRFARTLISSKVRNLEKQAEETTFSVILPENAFISEFEMEIKEKVYKAYVKEKEEAKRIYQEAVASGRTAAHVELSARDSKTFTVSVNIEPESKTIFRLVYEELLQRQIGQYELVINIHPGQIVEDLGVEVHINESRPLTFVKTPSLRTGNEIRKNDEKLDPSAQIEIINNNSATVKFSPDKSQQKEFAKNLGGKKGNGLAGQFVVEYDVERDPQGGEVLVRDGYFVHFFAPSELQPLPKHVVFVLDHSGSMYGRNIEQLTEAMQNILSELHTDDLFNIVRFADDASVWNAVENKFIPVSLNNPQYGNLEPHLREMNLSGVVEATKDNIEKAKNVVKDHSNLGSTNIIAGLEVGLFLTKRAHEKFSNKYEPMIVFLTDGYANVGLSSAEEITNTVTKVNSGGIAIFSLSFGIGADKDFLRKLSSRNHGFSRHIYEASDASLQLQDFYKLISSPLLSNITFSYVDGVSNVTKTHYPIFFKGSELVVAGKTDTNGNISPQVYGKCIRGNVNFNTTKVEPVSSLERLWAYLTVNQILKERETAENTTELTRKALDISLKYSFVTAVTSLVVVKPNQTDSLDTQNPEPRTFEDRSALFSPGVAQRASAGGPYRLSSPVQYSGNFYGGMPGSPGQQGIYAMSRPMLRPMYQPVALPRPPPQLTTPRMFHPKVHSTQPQNPTIPQWLEELEKNHGNITASDGSTFKLGHSGDATTRPDCPNTPLNSTGVCTIIFDCPRIYSLLTDVTVYLKYFCPLNEYAGVCCPAN